MTLETTHTRVPTLSTVDDVPPRTGSEKNGDDDSLDFDLDVYCCLFDASHYRPDKMTPETTHTSPDSFAYRWLVMSLPENQPVGVPSPSSRLFATAPLFCPSSTVPTTSTSLRTPQPHHGNLESPLDVWFLCSFLFPDDKFYELPARKSTHDRDNPVARFIFSCVS